ncbi:MAG: hypothetical protein CO183_00760 [Candidatus Zambryskibacteria bacterium CG_4_9_14_3_um_filter_42_9]|uniref:SMC-Scp complex subunit ScpB n=1 Tax=Candidatus Zambryskibacteria bacterium CG22_combo_CG10-13_8_21_14_all_42_17 TaxID=1975118 RepID=A0A2H0BDS8_9BACT|nr:MAG: hypothetical protein COX06_01405 [Candidatus Zambryskibacteria bacterium CG22_combo_CG10-13_8_21_14_all_42_17]PJA36950.1 MAG: hypothetical protein CO183_00760 [Candidatus Zambryskibacteria bacterium CG_4_9_14_3_um_filter_42_9]
MILESKIEAILFFKNEPVSVTDLVKWLAEEEDAIKGALTNLSLSYKGHGIVVVSDGEIASLGTHTEMGELLASLQKEELSRELGRAGLETLALVLYKGPVSRREIDHIRGVNSGFIIRSLMIRGLIERTEGEGRSYSYKATLKLLEYLGVTSRENLPEYGSAFKKLEEFVKTSPSEQTEENE